MNIVNTTPHPIKLMLSGHEMLEFPPGHVLLRVDETFEPAPPLLLEIDGESIAVPRQRRIAGDLVLYDTIKREVTGLFTPLPATLYLVSAVVMAWVQQHGDELLRGSVLAPKSARYYMSAAGRSMAARTLVCC